MTDTADIKALRPTERAKLGFVTDDNTGGYYVAECEECGNIFPSQTCDGGEQIADTGDYSDCYCPLCGHVDPQECDNANLVWNVQQLKIVNLTKQLEAERQRADDAQRAGDNARSSRDLHHKVSAGLNERLIKAEARVKELEALKGEQVPVAWLNDAHLARGHIVGETGEEDAGPGMIPVYREKYLPPQKPVISKEKLCDWLEDNFDIDDSQRDAFANCFAHHCNCIVKKEDE